MQQLDPIKLTVSFSDLANVDYRTHFLQPSAPGEDAAGRLVTYASRRPSLAQMQQAEHAQAIERIQAILVQQPDLLNHGPLCDQLFLLINRIRARSVPVPEAIKRLRLEARGLLSAGYQVSVERATVYLTREQWNHVLSFHEEVSYNQILTRMLDDVDRGRVHYLEIEGYPRIIWNTIYLLYIEYERFCCRDLVDLVCLRMTDGDTYVPRAFASLFFPVIDSALDHPRGPGGAAAAPAEGLDDDEEPATSAAAAVPAGRPVFVIPGHTISDIELLTRTMSRAASSDPVPWQGFASLLDLARFLGVDEYDEKHLTTTVLDLEHEMLQAVERLPDSFKLLVDQWAQGVCWQRGLNYIDKEVASLLEQGLASGDLAAYCAALEYISQANEKVSDHPIPIVLNMRGEGITDAMVEQITAHLATAHTIDLSCGRDITPACLRHLARVRDLQVLDLWGCGPQFTEAHRDTLERGLGRPGVKLLLSENDPFAGVVPPANMRRIARIEALFDSAPVDENGMTAVPGHLFKEWKQLTGYVEPQPANDDDIYD